MQPISLYNTLHRAKEIFVPIRSGSVGMYVCGPTVYGRASIGNLRSYVFADTLRRVFEASGLRVTHVMNITDVGHLVGDGDDGQDKMEVTSQKTGETAWDIAKKYTDLFVGDLEKLHIKLPHVMPRATEHIAEQIAMIVAMEEKGFVYRISDGMYFDTAKLPSYGQLSRQVLAEKEEGARVGVNAEKRNASDFALWKFSPKGEKRHMEWESPWGKGFPGWHIECSAMSEKYLGVPFDVHTGGIDHIAVHHENELAQTEAARECLEARIWMHNEFLLVDGGKMSKSLGNTYSLDDVLEKNITMRAFRLFLLGAHYRTPLNFTFDAALAAQHAIFGLIDVAREWDAPAEPDALALRNFFERLHDDLDTPGALAVFWSVVYNEELPSAVRSATVLRMDEVLGLDVASFVAHPLVVSADAQKLLANRAEARTAELWQKSDELRESLRAMGYLVEDTPSGQRVREARK